jgi:hypothetical protein
MSTTKLRTMFTYHSYETTRLKHADLVHMSEGEESILPTVNRTRQYTRYHITSQRLQFQPAPYRNTTEHVCRAMDKAYSSSSRIMRLLMESTTLEKNLAA